MVRLLTGNSIFLEVRKLAKNSKNLDIAVAFWGANAVHETRLSECRNIRVLCDLYSGACDPSEIRQLAIVGAEVRACDGMHAKVWLGTDECILGSANASAAGLGYNNYSPMNDEACLYTKNPVLVQDVQKWFDCLWARSRTITEEDIRSVQLLYEKNRTQRRLSETTLLEALGSDSKRFKNIKVFAYTPLDYSPEADEAFKREAKSLYTSAALKRVSTPFYEGQRGMLEAGDTVIDFSIGRSGRVTYNGIWRAKDYPFVEVPLSDYPDNGIFLVDELAGVEGVRMTRGDQEAIKAWIKKEVGQAPKASKIDKVFFLTDLWSSHEVST